MKRILASNLFRLRKSSAFWAVAGVMFAWGCTAYGMMYINCRNLGNASSSLNTYFFNGNLCIGAALGVFSALFIGQQHMDGGLRSMISTGHSRHSIYLANLVTCFAAGIGFLLAFWLGGALVGLPGMGLKIYKGIQQPLPGVLWSVVAVLSYSALFCLLAMLDSSKSRSAVVCLLLAAFLFAGGFATRNGLEQPEFTTQYVTDDLVRFTKEENIPNPKFLRGTERKVYEALDALLPSCQALRPLLGDMDYSLTQPLYAAAWCVCLTGVGCSLFRRKDIR